MKTFDEWYDAQPMVLMDRKTEHRLTWEAAIQQQAAEISRLKAKLCKYQHIASPEDRKATKLLTEIERLKAELAEAKKDAELVDACHEFINSPISVESCERFNKTFEAMKGK